MSACLVPQTQTDATHLLGRLPNITGIDTSELHAQHLLHIPIYCSLSALCNKAPEANP